MTIVDFLEARIAEDELTANAAIDAIYGAADWQVLYTYRDVKDSEGHYIVLADSRYPTFAQAAHIARQDPARILRQCEAARAVISEFLRLEAVGEPVASSATENALRRLASVHSDHADFDQDWV